MYFKNNEKTALVKVLSDLVKVDGIVHQNEINYLRYIYDKFDIKAAAIKSADQISLEDALSILIQTDNTKKLAVIRMLQQLSIADDNLDSTETLLIAAIMVSLDLTMKNKKLPKARIISIRDISLKVDPTHVLYIEETFHKKINDRIMNSRQEIEDLLQKKGYEFIYIPYLTNLMVSKKNLFQETLQYIEPTLSQQDLKKIDNCLDLLSTEFFTKEIFLNYMNRRGVTNVNPSLLFKIKRYIGNEYTDFLLFEIDDTTSILDQINNMFDIIQNINEITPKLLPAKDRKMLDELNRVNMTTESETMEQLSYNGFYKVILDTILEYNAGSDVSRLYISETGVFLLLDKNETEICMPCLCKAIYILFLIHEEGIYLDALKEYRHEIFSIYKEISTYKDDLKLWDTVKSVTDYTGNTLNANLAKIKRAFKDQLGEKSNLYIISGERKEKKRIHIDRQHVIFEDKTCFVEIIHKVPK